MNLEDFFIAEYEKLKDDNEKLKSQVAELSKPKGAAGLLDARVVSTEVEAELVEDAKKVLLEEMDDAIKRLKGKEAKEAAE